VQQLETAGANSLHQQALLKLSAEAISLAMPAIKGRKLRMKITEA
jgi:hypothetical protein